MKKSCIVFLPLWAQPIADRVAETLTPARRPSNWQFRMERIHSRKGLNGVAIHCPRDAMLAFVSAVKRSATPFLVKNEGCLPSDAPVIVGRVVDGAYRVTAVEATPKPAKKPAVSLRERFFAQRRAEASRVTANQIFAHSVEHSRNIAGIPRDPRVAQPFSGDFS